MAKPTPRTRMPKGPARAPKVEGLDGQTCHKCTKPSTVWQLVYYCDACKPPADRGSNCKHTSTVTLHDVVVCSWCQSIVKHNP